MNVRFVIAAVGIVVIVGVLGGVKAMQIKQLIAMGEAFAKSGPPPEVVGSAAVQEQVWEKKLTATGSINPARGVTVSNDAAGVVSAIRFESGAVVKKGQILVELDSGVERAQLASAQARREYAKINAGRTRALVEQEALPKSQLDSDDATLRSLSADSGALQAQIDRKTVRAPFDGKLGIRQINLGQYLNSGTAITVLQATDAVYVDFTLPQQDLPILAVGMPVRLNETASGPKAEGAITAIDPTVDEMTRNVRVRAAVQSKKDDIRPGMYVNVSVLLPTTGKVTIVSQTAVVHASFGDSVFVVEDKKDDKGAVVNLPDGKPAKAARQQFVKIGESRGDFVAIVEGVKAGQEVVTAGAFKLRNGAGIVINNSVKVEPQINPRPENR